ncbi:MAG: hypothetical protein WDZ82_01440 [Candidatus Paceibacterota bacterium]
MHILIVGCGKLASAIIAACEEHNVSVSQYDPKQPRPMDDAVCIHTGSGRQLDDALALCCDQGAPFIMASTGLHEQPLFNAAKRIPVVRAPNLAFPVIYLLNQLVQLRDYLEPQFFNWEAWVTESHQSTKTSVPGTLWKIQEILNIPNENTRSIRDRGEQLALGVPEENLDWHAWHMITVEVSGVPLEYSCKINGGAPYGHGAVAVAKLLRSSPFLPRIHDVIDLLAH